MGSDGYGICKQSPVPVSGRVESSP
jgi:hypothetical protein